MVSATDDSVVTLCWTPPFSRVFFNTQTLVHTFHTHAGKQDTIDLKIVRTRVAPAGPSGTGSHSHSAVNWGPDGSMFVPCAENTWLQVGATLCVSSMHAVVCGLHTIPSWLACSERRAGHVCALR